jgi:protein SCO1/2
VQLSRPTRILIGLLAAGFIGSGAAMVSLLRGRAAWTDDAAGITPADSAEARTAAVAGMTIPAFAMVDQDGAAFTEERLRAGGVTVLDFMFTHCPTACPIMTETMAGLTEALADTDVRFVSISLDPKHDTPARLREYAELHEANPRRWSFLTDPAGNDAPVRAMVQEGLKFALDEDRSTPITVPGDAEPMFNIVHPTWFLLIGGDGGVKGLYRSSQAEEMERLEADARALDRASRPKP